MKKALVLAIVCALGLGFAGFAASPFTGSWATDICFGPITGGQALLVHDFLSTLDLDYTVGGWIFGMSLILDSAGLDNVYFDATGNLGAFSISSFLDFKPDPANPYFVSWQNAAQVSIAGVQFYGLMAVSNFDAQTSDIGTGFALGAIGTAGDLKVGAEIDFNLASSLGTVWDYGFDTLTSWVSLSCGTWTKGTLVVQTRGSCVCWTNFDLWAQFPFTCFSVLTKLNFNPTIGFNTFIVEMNDIDIGIPWLLLDDVDITFGIASKVITLDWQLVFSGVCFTPYFTLDVSGTPANQIDGISLRALLLSYSWNGVTFKAGEIFEYYHFTPTGGLTTTHACAISETYNEFFGVEIDGDSCCGGAFSAGVYNFFQTGATSGIFDWQLTSVNLEFGIASNLSLRLSLTVNTVQITTLCIGFTFTW